MNALVLQSRRRIRNATVKKKKSGHCFGKEKKGLAYTGEEEEETLEWGFTFFLFVFSFRTFDGNSIRYPYIEEEKLNEIPFFVGKNRIRESDQDLECWLFPQGENLHTGLSLAYRLSS